MEVNHGARGYWNRGCGLASGRVCLEYARSNSYQSDVHRGALHGVDVAFETNTAMPAAFLGQQLELREALENATRAKDVKSLEALEKSIARDKQALEQKLAQRIDADKDYQAAAGLVRELQFLEKLEAEIDGAYEVIE